MWINLVAYPTVILLAQTRLGPSIISRTSTQTLLGGSQFQTAWTCETTCQKYRKWVWDYDSFLPVFQWTWLHPRQGIERSQYVLQSVWGEEGGGGEGWGWDRYSSLELYVHCVGDRFIPGLHSIRLWHKMHKISSQEPEDRTDEGRGAFVD